MANSFWFRSDWINPLHPERYHWIDFAFVHASCEYDRRFGNFEFHLALLGFHVGGQWNVSVGDTEFQAHIEQLMKDMGPSNEDPAP